MRTTRAIGAGGLALLGVLLLATVPVGVAAAPPSASTAASGRPSERPPSRPPIEVWLDRPPPPAPQPGSRLEVGATVWDTLGNEIPRMGATIFLRAVPPGAGTPTEAVAISDWRGHYRGSVEVPAGGLDRLELGVSGTICENDVCRPDDWIFPVAGFGPPPAAPVTTLADARIVVGDTGLRAGAPADVSVVVRPSADWTSWPQPARVVVRAREPRGPNVATATLPLVDAAAGTYEGSITIPRAGEFVLEAATDADGGEATRFGTSMTRVAVAPGGGLGDASADAPGATEGGAEQSVPAVAVVMLALAAFLGLAVIFAGFRSSGR